MDPIAPKQSVFRPLQNSLSDTWLQVRAKPLIYVLIWLSLALAPYVILGFIFQKPLGNLLGEYFDMFESWDMESFAETQEYPPGYGPLTARILGYYAVIIGINSLIAVYMGAVMSGTISRFRDRTFPRFLDVLEDGTRLYIPYLVSVLYAVFRILIRPVLFGGGGLLVGAVFKSPALSFFGFFIGFFLFLGDLNRYGLSPFVHLSLHSNARESAQISKTFFQTHRPVISSLFLGLIMLPAMVLLLFYTLVFSSGFGSGGLLFIWLIQSIAQFGIVMTLINFARNTFIKTDNFGNADSVDIETEAVEPDVTGNNGD